MHISKTHKCKEQIRQKGLELGFNELGFSEIQRLDHLEKPMNEWIQKGYHGEMSWLEKNLEKRLNPAELFHGAKTIISLISWYHSDDYMDGCGISRFAVGRDYHKVVKKRGQKLIDYMREEFGDIQARIFVDSAPLMEREWAKKSGLGWIGKNGCLIQPAKGSWFFLGEIVMDLEILPDNPEIKNLCGSCTRCIQACPTDALLGDGLIDARKCISYLTIELKGEIDDNFKGNWENWIFGCDICQEVCPWNRKPINYQFEDFSPREEILELKQRLSANANDDEIENIINGTAIKRTGFKGLMRNLEYLKPKTGQE